MDVLQKYEWEWLSVLLMGWLEGGMSRCGNRPEIRQCEPEAADVYMLATISLPRLLRPVAYTDCLPERQKI